MVDDASQTEQICPRCGQSISTTAKFCKYCAFDLTSAGQPGDPEVGKTNVGRTCPNCGVGLNEGAAFCANCGKPIRGPLRKLLVGIAAGLVALIVTAATVFYLVSGTGSKKHSGLFPIVQGGKWGYINRQGQVIINPQFDAAQVFSEGLAAVQSAGKWGYINTAGEFVVNPQFEGAANFCDGLALVETNGQIRFINSDGKIVISTPFDTQPKHDVPPHYSEGLTWILSGGKFGYIDRNGNFAIKPQFGFASSFHDGLAVASQMEGPSSEDNAFGYIDTSGKFAINPQFGFCLPFTQGLAAVMVGNKWGYIDKKGTLVINPQFEEALPYSSEGIAIVTIADGKWQGIDKTGKVVISPQFEGNFLSLKRGGPGAGLRILEADDPGTVTFSEGLRSEKSGEKYGFIDTTGRYVITPQFDRADPFIDGLAFVVTRGNGGEQLGYIDKTGKYVWSLGGQ